MPEIKRLDINDEPVDVSRFSAANTEPSVPTIDSTTAPVASRATATSKRWSLSPRGKKILAVVLGVLLVFLIVGGALGFYTYQTVKQLQAQAQETEVVARAGYDAFKAQNLPETQRNLNEVKAKVEGMRATYNRLGFYRFVPLASRYYTDGEHGFNAADAGVRAALKSIDAITPYADVLGFTGEGTFTGGTTEDRLKVVLQTIDKVTPVMDDIANELKTVETELAEIDPNHYPEQVQGRPIRPYLLQAQAGSQGAFEALTTYRPIIEQLPVIAGGKGQRQQYLVLFQNDNELRPTGGFLTAYSIINIEDGKVTPEKSDDIYELDKRFTKRIPIPTTLGRYLTTEQYFHLRDMNTSPDYRTSMEQFVENYKTVRGEPTGINGVIAVDTHVLVDLLTVLGPVEVPGYGTFSAENDPACDCPQVVHALSEIITRPTPYIREDRKGILGPMMRSILTKAYGAPKQNWPQLFETGLKNIDARHVQMYFFDEKSQAAAEAINAAGRLHNNEQAPDFLAIVNANLGGAKSNLFVNYEVNQQVSLPENGKITKTVEITYRNNRRADNCNLEAGLLCLNSTLRDWTRLYLPTGAELVEAQGFTQTPNTYEEAGFNVIDGFFILEPNSQAKLRLTYTVPYTDTETYKVKLWKQGGVGTFKTSFDVNGLAEEVVVEKDTVVEVPFE